MVLLVAPLITLAEYYKDGKPLLLLTHIFSHLICFQLEIKSQAHHWSMSTCSTSSQLARSSDNESLTRFSEDYDDFGDPGVDWHPHRRYLGSALIFVATFCLWLCTRIFMLAVYEANALSSINSVIKATYFGPPFTGLFLVIVNSLFLQSFMAQQTPGLRRSLEAINITLAFLPFLIQGFKGVRLPLKTGEFHPYYLQSITLMIYIAACLWRRFLKEKA